MPPWQRQFSCLVSRGQTLDPARVDLPYGVPHAPAADHSVGNDLGKWNEHESTIEQSRVRQRQLRCVQNDIVVRQEIDIDNTRAPACLCRAVAAQHVFDVLALMEKRLW